jgi:hypothetical protein
MTVNGPMTRSDRVATLEEAKAQFQKSWDAWKAWAKLGEMPYDEGCTPATYHPAGLNLCSTRRGRLRNAL